MALLLLILCNYTVHTFASDSIPDISNGPVETELVDENNDVPDIAEAPEGWDGTTEADFNKDDAIPVQGLDEPSEIIPYATSNGTWIQASDGRWWYRYDDGTYPSNGWAYINGYWYYFDADGWMLTGWLTVGGKTYYLGTNGAMAIGWRQIGSYWYYFWSGGSMATGWQYLAYSGGNAWFYFYSSGKMATGAITLPEGQHTPERTGYFASNGVWQYTVSTLSWDLMGGDNRLSIAGNTVYSDLILKAMNTWCAYKSGVIYPAINDSSADVMISDVNNANLGWRGLTDSATNTITFNRAYMGSSTTSSKNLKTCLHELGHGLGLAHNDSDDVMYYTESTTTALTTNDKKSLDASLAS